VACGIVAGVVALLAVVVVQAVETSLFGAASRASLWVAFVGAGGAVLWLADRRGLLGSPYTEPALGLGRREVSDPDGDNRARRHGDKSGHQQDVTILQPLEHEPVFLKAINFVESDIGTCEWNRGHNSDLLTVSNNGLTIGWESRKPDYTGKYYPPAWVPASTRLNLHSGKFRWDFVVEEMGQSQIGVGFMLLWDIGPDWGFFGYLGASPTAWAYDPSTGDVVCNTKSIQADLPRFADGHAGIVSVFLDLPRCAAGSGRFRVNGLDARSIALPEGAVVMPAACFLKEGQRVRLAAFERS
jgi:hypothetical protein